MLVDSFHDTGVFFASFLCGQFIGLIFDIFRGYRKNKKVSKNILSVQDSVFCAIAFYIFYKTVYLTNSGEIRWYTVAGAIMGLVLYLVAESCQIMKIISIIWKIIFSVTGFFSKGIRNFFMLLKKSFLIVKKKVAKALSEKTKHFRQFFIKKTTKTSQNDV